MTPGSHHLGPPWRPFVVGIVLLATSAPVFGQAVYNYQGNNFDDFPFVPSVFDGTMSVAGSFTLPLALLPNLVSQDVNVATLDFSLSNGIRIFTPLNSVVCLFEVSTGLSGQIVGWNIVLREPGIPVSNPQPSLTSRRTVSAADGGYISISDGTDCGPPPPAGLASSDAGQVLDQPGVWTSDAGGVPALPRWAWAPLLVLLAVAGAATLRSRQRA